MATSPPVETDATVHRESDGKTAPCGKIDEARHKIWSEPQPGVGSAAETASKYLQGTCVVQQPGESGRPFLPTTKVSADELRFVGDNIPAKPGGDKTVEQQRAERWQAVKQLVNRAGTDPASAILSAIGTSKLVGVGDHHPKDDHPTSQLTQTLLAHMNEFARAGVTDMFIEMPQALQPVFDRFNNDRSKGDLDIPSQITGADGKPLDTPEAKGALEFLKENKDMFPQMTRMLRVARDNGIRIHAVDSNYNAVLRAPALDGDADARKAKLDQLESSRDQTMKDNMLAVLNGPADANGRQRKGLAVLGSLHLATGNDQPNPSAFQMLKPELNGQMKTFFSLVGSLPGADQSSLYPLTGQIDHPVAVPTHGADGQENALSPINALHSTDARLPLSSFDGALLFPEHPQRGNPFNQDTGEHLLSDPRLANPAGEELKSLIRSGIDWHRMPPPAADTDGFAARQVLDRMLFNNGGIKPPGWSSVENALGLPTDSTRSLKDLSYVVIDSRGTWDHAVRVDAALKQGDPTASQDNTMNLWLPTRPPAVDFAMPAGTNASDRPELAEAQSYSQLVQQDLARAAQLSDNVVAAGGTAPSVILPETVSPYTLGGDGPRAISLEQLGVEKLTNPSQADGAYKQRVLDGLKKLSDSGDVRAKSVLDTLDSLNKLAKTSKIFLSANNEDTLDLGVFLSDRNPNITSVSSLDRNSDQAQYNSETGRFAKALAPGTIVAVPDNLRGQLDMRQFGNAIIRPPEGEESLTGKDVSKVTVSDQQFAALKTEQAAMIQTSATIGLIDSMDLARGTLVHEGELPDDFVKSIAQRADLLKTFADAAGSPPKFPRDILSMPPERQQDAVRQMIHDGALIKALREGGATVAMQQLTANNKVLTEAQLKAEMGQYYDGTDKEDIARTSYSAWLTSMEDRLQGVLLSFPQAKILYDASHSNHKPQDRESPSKDMLFQVSGPFVQKATQYLTAYTNDGRAIALPIDFGNSFSAPYLAGVQRYGDVTGVH